MPSMSDHPARSIDEYIAMQKDEFKPMLENLRMIIRSASPKAEELISYQVPSFKFRYMLVGFGVNKKYVSLYTMSPPLVKAMKKDLKDVKLSGTTLHFSPEEKLPVTLIKKIVKARIKENQARAEVREMKN